MITGSLIARELGMILGRVRRHMRLASLQNVGVDNLRVLS